ncbi:MAG: sialidase family protein [Armatimonadota bacterium]|nr:sialidase family protein [Armatimonadota bacterium]
MQHIVVFRDESVYASHASACLAANGDLLVAFRQAPFEHIFAHVHPRATVGLIRSKDLGHTWEEYTTAFDPGEGTNLNDPSLTTLRDGTIILTVFTTPCPRDPEGWGDQALPVRGNDYYYVPTERHILVCRSRDHGYTWEGPFQVPFKMAGVFGAVVELEAGSILMPITARIEEPNKEAALLIRSEDQGRTWSFYSTITTWTGGDQEALTFGLPSVVAYDKEHFLAVGWTVAVSGTLVTHSFDGGKTWEPVQPVDTRGSCMHLCVTSRGTTLMSYGYREKPFGIRVLPSYDQGRTWDIRKAAALRSDGAMRDLGYPWTIELPNGKLFCVYYFNVNETQKPYYKEQAALALCEKWGLDPDLYTYRTAGLRFIAATIFTEDELKELAGTGIPEPAACAEGPTLL